MLLLIISVQSYCFWNDYYCYEIHTCFGTYMLRLYTSLYYNSNTLDSTITTT